MKKVLLGLLFTAFGFGASAQSVSPVKDDQKGYILSPFSTLAKKNTSSLNKAEGDSLSTWYDWLDSARNFTTFTGFNNSFLFPDSLVKQIYGDGQGGTMLSYVGIHSIGQNFDPGSSFFYDKRAFKGGFTLDSVAFAYGYQYHMPGTVDTLVVQFYPERTGGLRRTTFTGSGEKTTVLPYDINKNLGAGATKEFRYLLDQKDTATALKILSVPVPGGLKIAPERTVAFTVTYKPGYSYSLDDTLDSRWDQPEPTRKLNNFRIFVQQDNAKEQDNAYNHGHKLIRSVRHDLPSAGGWKGFYIPGDAWNDYNEHLYSLFHITFSGTINVEEIKAQNGYGLGNIFPNPTQNTATLEFVLPASENVNVQVYNVVGQHVKTIASGSYASGRHTVNVNTEDMKPGIYFYTINAGNFTQTKRFSVVK